MKSIVISAPLAVSRNLLGVPQKWQHEEKKIWYLDESIVCSSESPSHYYQIHLFSPWWYIRTRFIFKELSNLFIMQNDFFLKNNAISQEHVYNGSFLFFFEEIWCLISHKMLYFFHSGCTTVLIIDSGGWGGVWEENAVTLNVRIYYKTHGSFRNSTL